MLDQRSIEKHRTDCPITWTTVPVQDVLKMMAEEGSIKEAAVQYYYDHYASDAEREWIKNREIDLRMDKGIKKMIPWIIAGLFIAAVVCWIASALLG